MAFREAKTWLCAKMAPSVTSRCARARDCKGFRTSTGFAGHGRKPCGSLGTRFRCGSLRSWLDRLPERWNALRAMPPYNPLDKLSLARSIQVALLNQKPCPLRSTDPLPGAGVYAIYYSGGFEPYLPCRASRPAALEDRPVYVGKAIPKGGRKGGLGLNSATGTALRDRLRQHATSIDEALNLDLDDFECRSLVVEDIWIPLGENILIETFSPVWNKAIDGFGNKTPGVRRATQFRSPWDVLHPGRSFAAMLAASPVDSVFLVRRVEDFLAGRPMARLPRAVAEQTEEEADEE